MPNKSSPLDILLTLLLKSRCHIFAPAITHLINQSFARGKFPAMFKVVQVTSLLKKQGLDKSQPSSYRPISNFNTISKIIERLVPSPMNSHVYASENFNSFQSAYRAGHSTKTTLLHLLGRLIDCFTAHQHTKAISAKKRC